MSATALQPTTIAAPRLRPASVPPGPHAPQRPALRVLEGGRSPAGHARRAVYRRRRLTVLAILVAVVAAILLLASAVLARVAGDGTPDPVAGSSSAAEVHVVQPGDTLWSIARSLEPEGDVRLVVDRLVDLNGGAPITVGQQLVLP
jgi:nucleoid-associated protein YgaU